MQDPASPRHAQPPPPLGRRAVLAAISSAIVPGTGQLLAGRRRLGTVLIIVTLAVAGGFAAWVATRSTVALATWLLRPATLVTVMVVNVMLLVARAGVAIHAYRAVVERRRLATRWPVVALAAVLVVMVAMPHGAVAYAGMRTQAVLAAVFAAPSQPGDARQPPAALHEMDPTVIEELLAAGSDRDVDGSQDGEGPSVSFNEPKGQTPGSLIQPELQDGADGGDADADAEQPTAPASNPWVAAGRLTVAVLGSDAGPGRFSARTDAMMVVTVDTQTGQTAIFSIDRYLRDFPVPERIRAVYEDICQRGGAWDYLNSLYTCATGRGADAFAALYPASADPGAQALSDTLELLLDLPVDAYAKVDMEGFVRIVDALGGVTIDLARPITVRMSPAHEDTDWRVFTMPAGSQVMDGETALAFARVRDPGDGPRMQRQRCLVSSVIENTGITDVLFRFGALSTAIERHVVTTLPVDALPDLIEVFARVDHRDVVGVGFGPPTYRAEGHVPEVGLIRSRVRQLIDDPVAAAAEVRTVDAADELCR